MGWEAEHGGESERERAHERRRRERANEDRAQGKRDPQERREGGTGGENRIRGKETAGGIRNFWRVTNTSSQKLKWGERSVALHKLREAFLSFISRDNKFC